MASAFWARRMDDENPKKIAKTGNAFMTPPLLVNYCITSAYSLLILKKTDQ